MSGGGAIGGLILSVLALIISKATADSREKKINKLFGKQIEDVEKSKFSQAEKDKKLKELDEEIAKWNQKKNWIKCGIIIGFFVFLLLVEIIALAISGDLS